MILAVIPARANSRRLPGKNLMDLGGRPLIAYSILLARSIPEIDHVLVASDGVEILQAAAVWRAAILDLPTNLTGDEARLVGSLQYAVSILEGCDDCFGKPIDWVVLLQPTSPLRLVPQCRGWIQEVLARPEVDGLLTVDLEPYKLAGTTPEGYYLPEYSPGIIKQQVKPRLRENGSLYILKADNIRRGRLFGPRMLWRECRREQSLANIDYAWDLDFTRWAYSHFGYDQEFQQMEAVLGQHP